MHTIRILVIRCNFQLCPAGLEVWTPLTGCVDFPGRFLVEGPMNTGTATVVTAEMGPATVMNPEPMAR
jgi:hypothetical protein